MNEKAIEAAETLVERLRRLSKSWQKTSFDEATGARSKHPSYLSVALAEAADKIERLAPPPLRAREEMLNEQAIDAAEKAYPAPGYYPQVRHRISLKAALAAALPHLTVLRAREEIARIIDPVAFEVRGTWMELRMELRSTAESCQNALQKADLILSRTAGQEWRDTSVLQDDLRDMLRALGLPDGARPQSPHEVFRECIEAVKVLKPQSSAEYHQKRGAAWDIIDEALIAYREFMLDDDYDAITALKKICDRMEERRALYLPAPPVAEPKAGDVSRETLASSPDAPVVSRS